MTNTSASQEPSYANRFRWAGPTKIQSIPDRGNGQAYYLQDTKNSKGRKGKRHLYSKKVEVISQIDINKNTYDKLAGGNNPAKHFIDYLHKHIKASQLFSNSTDLRPKKGKIVIHNLHHNATAFWHYLNWLNKKCWKGLVVVSREKEDP